MLIVMGGWLLVLMAINLLLLWESVDVMSHRLNYGSYDGGDVCRAIKTICYSITLALLIVTFILNG